MSKARKILLTVVAIGMLNFAAFAVATFVLHGDAVGARSECPPGDYVVNKADCHHVSHAAYVCSKVLGYSAMISGALAFGASLILHYQKVSAAADAPHSR